MKYLSLFSNTQVLLSDRKDGSFRQHEQVKQVIERMTHLPTAVAKLSHSNHAHIIDTLCNTTFNADALITPLANQVLSFFVADCFPVILFDQQNQIQALLHCGWKSLSQEIIVNTIQTMQKLFQTKPDQLQAWVGPGICAKHYLHHSAPDQMNNPKWKKVIHKIEYNMYSINLPQFIQQELQQLGIPQEAIFSSDMCTFEPKNQLFSHHRATVMNELDGRFLVATWFTA